MILLILLIAFAIPSSAFAVSDFSISPNPADTSMLLECAGEVEETWWALYLEGDGVFGSDSTGPIACGDPTDGSLVGSTDMFPIGGAELFAEYTGIVEPPFEITIFGFGSEESQTDCLNANAYEDCLNASSFASETFVLSALEESTVSDSVPFDVLFRGVVVFLMAFFFPIWLFRRARM